MVTGCMGLLAHPEARRLARGPRGKARGCPDCAAFIPHWHPEMLEIGNALQRSIVTGNRSEQTMQAGNAVSANVAQWLGEKVREVL